MLPHYLSELKGTCAIAKSQSLTVTRATKFTEGKSALKADFQSVQFSERAEILLFAGENVALKLNR